jgi:hypothetical protein
MMNQIAGPSHQTSTGGTEFFAKPRPPPKVGNIDSETSTDGSDEDQPIWVPPQLKKERFEGNFPCPHIPVLNYSYGAKSGNIYTYSSRKGCSSGFVVQFSI